MTRSTLSTRFAAAAMVLSALAAPAVHAAVVGQIAAPITFTTNAGNHAATSFSTAQTGDLYIAMTISLDAGTLGSNDFLALWLDNVATGDHTNRPNIGLKSNLGSPNQRDWMVRGSGTNGSFAPDQALVGSTTTLWAHLYKVSNANYNRAIHTVNDVTATFGNDPQHMLKFTKLALVYAVELGTLPRGSRGALAAR
jgi:hypothetical protein